MRAFAEVFVYMFEEHFSFQSGGKVETKLSEARLFPSFEMEKCRFAKGGRYLLLRGKRFCPVNSMYSLEMYFIWACRFTLLVRAGGECGGGSGKSGTHSRVKWPSSKRENSKIKWSFPFIYVRQGLVSVCVFIDLPRFVPQVPFGKVEDRSEGKGFRW